MTHICFAVLAVLKGLTQEFLMLSKWSPTEIVVGLWSFRGSPVWSWIYYNKKRGFYSDSGLLSGLRIPKCTDYITQELVKVKFTRPPTFSLCAIRVIPAMCNQAHIPHMFSHTHILFTGNMKVTFCLANKCLGYLEQISFVYRGIMTINLHKQSCTRPGNYKNSSLAVQAIFSLSKWDLQVRDKSFL